MRCISPKGLRVRTLRGFSDKLQGANFPLPVYVWSGMVERAVQACFTLALPVISRMVIFQIPVRWRLRAMALSNLSMALAAWR